MSFLKKKKTVAFDEKPERVLLEKLDKDVNQLEKCRTKRSGAYFYSVAKWLNQNKMIMKTFMQYTTSPPSADIAMALTMNKNSLRWC